jgi:hypothetical protein
MYSISNLALAVIEQCARFALGKKAYVVNTCHCTRLIVDLALPAYPAEDPLGQDANSQYAYLPIPISSNCVCLVHLGRL